MKSEETNTEGIAEPRKTLKVTAPAEKAAGFKAVSKTLEYMYREPGLVGGFKRLAKMNQKGGFDCSSCAWPDPDEHRSAHEYCENGAKALASESTSKTIGKAFFAKYSIEALAAQSDHWHELQGRIVEPLVRREGESHYRAISWQDAYAEIAQGLKDLPSAHQASFYTSGRASNEAAFVYQLMVRMFGTNNLPDCSNMCHESSGAALNKTIGIGKGTVKLADFAKADVILVIGQNPGTNHPRMLSALQEAVRNGATIISINPLFEAGLKGFAHPQEVKGMLNLKTQLAADHYAVRPGGDLALFKAVGKLLLEWQEEAGGIFDEDFIATYTSGLNDYLDALRKETWEELVEESGIPKEQIHRLAALLRDAKGLITCWAMGLTQTDNAVATIQEIVNLHLVRGQIGKAGAGLCPVRGHSNVQGDRTMGVWEKMSDEFHDALDQHFAIETPRAHGYDVVETIQAMLRGKVEAFVALGGNFLSASPDTNLTRQALEQCKLTVQISTKLNRSHCHPGQTGFILPCLVRSEKDMRGDHAQIISTENSMGVVQSSEGHFPPVSENLLSEVQILCGIAKELIPEHTALFQRYTDQYDEIRSDVEQVIPGFEKFNTKVREQGGFYLPNGPAERRFTTVSGKAHFTANERIDISLPSDMLMLQTLRTHDQFNTTIYGMEDRYRGIYNDRYVVLMNEHDMKDRGISSLSKVNVTSHFEGETRVMADVAVIPYDMPKGACAAYFPEANVLVPLNKTAKVSNTPTSKSIAVTIDVLQ
ncbi:MAG: FdhF/YdeP family oxidoreductase [Akkermansiaceae bacterium]